MALAASNQMLCPETVKGRFESGCQRDKREKGEGMLLGFAVTENAWYRRWSDAVSL